jgi:adenylyltransferase/sulfurtransferase
MVTVFASHLDNPIRPGEKGPCYRCLYPEPPDPGSVPSCAEGGVLGVLPGIVGTLQANEVLKLILGIGTPAIGRLLTFAALDLEVKTFKIRRDPTCPICGDHPTITAPIDYEQFCGAPILDPASLEETKREVIDARTPKSAAHAPKPDPSLDARAIPPGFGYKEGWETTPRHVTAKLDANDPAFVLVDVREPNEYDITHIVDKDQLIPRAQWMSAPGLLESHKDDEVVVHCKSGARSLQVTQLLRNNGFKNVKSMAGGILLWNKDVKPGGPQY